MGGRSILACCPLFPEEKGFDGIETEGGVRTYRCIVEKNDNRKGGEKGGKLCTRAPPIRPGL